MSWIAIPLLLIGAAVLLADIGVAGLWIAIIAVGIALVAMSRMHPSLTAKNP